MGKKMNVDGYYQKSAKKDVYDINLKRIQELFNNEMDRATRMNAV